MKWYFASGNFRSSIVRNRHESGKLWCMKHVMMMMWTNRQNSNFFRWIETFCISSSNGLERTIESKTPPFWLKKIEGR
jgi:hypothetical protein